MLLRIPVLAGICVAGGGVAGEASIPDRGGKHNRNQFLSDLSLRLSRFWEKLFTIGGFVVQVRWLLLAVWMTGTVCIAWSRIRFYRQLVRRFGHLPSICDESYLKILEEVKRENGYAFETTVIVDKNIRTILEFGYFRQIIFLPKAAYPKGEH